MEVKIALKNARSPPRVGQVWATSPDVLKLDTIWEGHSTPFTWMAPKLIMAPEEIKPI